MSLENNPLKQYFRRPGIYLKLPSGGLGYEPGVIDFPESGDLPVYPMTAIDEITSKTPDSLYNGSAVVDIITSCIPAIKQPWKITSIDLDAILVAIKIATNGTEMEIETTCGECEETSKFGVNLSMVLHNFRPGDYESGLVIDQLKIKFRPLDYKSLAASSIKQFEIQKSIILVNSMIDGPEKEAKSNEILKTITDSTVEILVDTIDCVITPESIVNDRMFIMDFIKNTDKKTFEAIRDHSVKLRESTQTQPLHITCTQCKHEYDQPFTLNISDFFA
jgi:hypothetical protein